MPEKHVHTLELQQFTCLQLSRFFFITQLPNIYCPEASPLTFNNRSLAENNEPRADRTNDD